MRLRRSVFALLVSPLVFVVPATAHAGTSIVSGQLHIQTDGDTATSFAADQILISAEPTKWSIMSMDPEFDNVREPLPAPGAGCVLGTDPFTGLESPAFIECDYAGGDASLGAAVAVGFGNDEVRTSGSFPVEFHGEAGNDTLTGGPLADKLIGGAGNDELDGSFGTDTITGGAGQDTFRGGPDVDTLHARDGESDVIDCGEGHSSPTPTTVDAIDGSDNDTANLDFLPADPLQADPNTECEVVNRAAVPIDPGPGPGTGTGGTDTGGTGTGTGTTNNPPPAKTPPGTLVEGVRFEKIIDTGRLVDIPDLRGKDVLQALLTLQKAGINVNLEPFPVNRLRRQLPASVKPAARWAEGDIVVQERATSTLSGSRSTIAIVVRYWDGPTVQGCAEEMKDFIGLPEAQFREIGLRERCRIDDTRVAIVTSTRKAAEIDVSSGDRCEVTGVSSDGKSVDTILSIPRDPALQDLRIIVISGYKDARRGPGPSLKDWSYIAGSSNNHLFLKIVGRTGQPVDGAVVTLDTQATWPGTAPADAQQNWTTLTQANNGGGIIDREFRTGRRAGMIKIAARATDKAGHSVCGAAEIPAKLIGSGAGRIPVKGDYFNTAAGRSYVFASNGNWAFAGDAKPNAELPPAGRARAIAPRGLLDDLFGAIASIFTGAHAVGSKGANVADLADKNVVLGQIALGQPLKANPPVSQIVSAGAGNLIAVGSGNIISNDGASIISNDGASIISGGGGNIISGGAGNLTIGLDGAKIISGGGGNIISGGGGNIRSDTVNMSTAQIISNDGASIISGGGGNVLAATGSAVMAAGIISGGAGN